MEGECDCAKLAEETDGNADRVGLFADAAPDCGCETVSVSPHSPGPVGDDETIGRLVCVPMHVHKKRPELLPSFFGHAFTFGLSAQRLERASEDELASWLNAFVGAADDRVWLGHVESAASTVRAIRRVGQEDSRGFCIYDAALEANAAHVEIGAASRVIAEADQIEARALLRRAFGDGKIVPRSQLKAGAVIAMLESGLAERPVPAQWATLVG